MRGTIVRIGVTGAGALLAVGLFGALPAGATGSGGHDKNARSDSTACFSGSGHTQGKSHSDPDGMSNGGADKPGCAGGFDADKDGNNGCGNDADREDDNNGNCGRRKVKDDVRSDRDVRSEHEGHHGRCERDGTIVGSTTTTSTSTTTTTTTMTAPPAAGGGTDTSVEAAGAVPAVGVLAAEASSPAPAASAAIAGDTGPVATEASTQAATPRTEVLGETLSRPGTLARTGAGVGGLALLGGLLCGGGRLTVLARRFLRID